MKLKFYLRGLGIGIVVTALVLHFTYADTLKTSLQADAGEIQTETIITETISNSEDNTDEDSSVKNDTDTVIEQEIETNVALAKLETQTNTKEQDTTDEAENTLTNNNEDEVVYDAKLTFDENEASDEDELPADEAYVNQDTSDDTENLNEEQQQSEDTENSTEIIEIAIVHGDDSGTVSRKLYNAGLVDNASEFDYYLMQHGYDKRISVGTVKISSGSTWQEIAEKISGN